MYAVVRRRHHDPLEHTKTADQAGVYPELVNQVSRVDRDENLEWEADDKQRQVEDPAKQETRTGLPQRRRQVVFLTLVVDRVRGPQNRYLVTEAVKPVVKEVPRDGGNCEILEHESPGDKRQELREITRRRIEHPGTDAVDGIVTAVKPGMPAPVHDHLDDDRKEKERHGKRNQVHAASLR